MNTYLKGVAFHSLIFILILFGCSRNTINIAEFESIRSVEMPDCGMIAPIQAKLYISESDTIITFVDQAKLLLRFFDLNLEKFVDSANIKVFDHYVYIQNFEILSPDSIILAYNTSYLASFHDEAVVLLNRKGEKIDQFNFRGAPVLLATDSDKVQKRLYCHSKYDNFPLIFKDNRLISSLILYQKEAFGDEIRKQRPFTLGKLSLDTNNNYHGIYSFDSTYYKDYFPASTKSFRGCMGYNNQVVFSYGYNSKLFFFDFDKEIIKTKWIDFISIDTIMPSLSDPPKYNDLTKAEFQEIYYNSFTKQYYRIARLPLNKNATYEMFDFPQHVLIILDSNLNKIAEGLLPFGCEAPLIPFNEGFLVWDKLKSKKTGKITLRLIKTTILRKSPIYLKNSISKQFNDNKIDNTITKKKYLNTICNSFSGFNQFVLIDIDISCPCVTSKIGAFFEKNNELFQKNKISLILISKNHENVSEFLNTYNLKNLENRFIFSDTTNLYKRAFALWGNVKYLLRQNGHIKLEEHYASGDLNKLYSILKANNMKSRNNYVLPTD